MSNIKTIPTEWIYFFEEPKRHTGLIELGRTGRTVEDRNRDKRSVDPWIEIASYPVVDCEQAEKEIIEATKFYRYSHRKEILSIDWPTLKNIVEPILSQWTHEGAKERRRRAKIVMGWPIFLENWKKKIKDIFHSKNENHIKNIELEIKNIKYSLPNKTLLSKLSDRVFGKDPIVLEKEEKYSKLNRDLYYYRNEADNFINETLKNIKVYFAHDTNALNEIDKIIQQSKKLDEILYWIQFIFYLEICKNSIIDICGRESYQKLIKLSKEELEKIKKYLLAFISY